MTNHEEVPKPPLRTLWRLIDDFNSYMQQYAISNGLYLINNNGDNVYYTPAFYVNTVSYAVQMLYILSLVVFPAVGLNLLIGLDILDGLLIELHMCIY